MQIVTKEDIDCLKGDWLTDNVGAPTLSFVRLYYFLNFENEMLCQRYLFFITNNQGEGIEYLVLGGVRFFLVSLFLARFLLSVMLMTGISAVSFYGSPRYLEHEELLKHPNNKVMLLRPSMVFLLKNTKGINSKSS